MRFFNHDDDHLGWGHTQQDGEMSNILQQVQLPVISNSLCKEKFHNIFRSQPIPDIRLDESSVICAGFDIGGKDACQGDSGGPLMLPLRENTSGFAFYQIGIVSRYEFTIK